MLQLFLGFVEAFDAAGHLNQIVGCLPYYHSRAKLQLHQPLLAVNLSQNELSEQLLDAVYTVRYNTMKCVKKILGGLRPLNPLLLGLPK